MVCKVCNRDLVKLRDVKPKSGKTYYYVNEFGKKWSGNTCPSCKNANNECAHVEMDPMTDRLCTICNGNLPKSRYFKHAQCDNSDQFYDWGI